MFNIIVRVFKDVPISKVDDGYWTKVAIFKAGNTGLIRRAETVGYVALPKKYVGGAEFEMQVASIEPIQRTYEHAKYGVVTSTRLVFVNPIYPIAKAARKPRQERVTA